jgi:sulfur relay (sulfurtransferase) DsrC/TusE family protein
MKIEKEIYLNADGQLFKVDKQNGDVVKIICQITTHDNTKDTYEIIGKIIEYYTHIDYSPYEKIDFLKLYLFSGETNVRVDKIVNIEKCTAIYGCMMERNKCYNERLNEYVNKLYNGANKISKINDIKED